MEMPEDGVWWLNYSQYEDLRLYEVGIQRCAPSYSFGPIIRDRYILHYVFEGEGVLRIDDKEFKVKSNSFFCYRRMCLFSIRRMKKNHGSMHGFIFMDLSQQKL